MLIGALLAALCFATAPVLVAFYREPRLFWVTEAMAAGFLFNAGGVQHFALLQRHLRYITLAVIDAVSQLSSIAVGVGLAVAGLGYWALVGAAIIAPATATACAWVVSAWVPGRPRWNVGIRSMLFFGGTITLNGLVVYAAYNAEKILLGRFWGADALGIYGRAFQLTRIPADYINGAVAVVAFSALSRLQGDPVRLARYFLKAYSLVVSMTLPLTIYCFIFADEIVRLLFGPNWASAGILFRILSPTVLILGMINPLSWLLLSIGLQARSLKIGFVIAPLVVTAYVIGLPHGPIGVAIAYSTAMSMWFVPHIVWCLHGTMVSVRALLLVTSRPFLSGFVAGLCAFAIQHYFGPSLGLLVGLLVGTSVMFATYILVLLFVLGQLQFYLDLLRVLKEGWPAANRLAGLKSVPEMP
jgi:O-antigen/teichoic acid export membrane protein